MVLRNWIATEALADYVIVGFCLAFGILAFWLDFNGARQLKMDTEAPVWVVDAVPPALSLVGFHHERLYTSLNAVYDRYYAQIKDDKSAARINQAIADILAEQPSITDRSDRLLGNDDKGIVDL